MLTQLGRTIAYRKWNNGNGTSKCRKDSDKLNYG